MRPTPWKAVEKYRWTVAPDGCHSRYGDDFGCFIIPYRGVLLWTMVSAGSAEDGMLWEHVSAHVEIPRTTLQRMPNWGEMCFLKETFWLDTETVVQFHPPKNQYVNIHPNVLHLWRPIGLEIPLPSMEAV